MAPKAHFTKNDIIETAFSIVKKDGISALSARRIAKELKCTVRPIYHYFQNMDEVKDLVVERAMRYAIEFLFQEEAEVSTRGIGKRYIKFAQHEKKLFRLLFMSKDVAMLNSGETLKLLFSKLQKYPAMRDMTTDQLNRICMHMWIYAHGLATLLSIEAIDRNEEELLDGLYHVGTLVVAYEQSLTNPKLKLVNQLN